MLSAWKAKMQTSVTRSAETATGWSAAVKRSYHACPRARTATMRVTTPAPRGITMKKTTEYSRTTNGTDRDEAPLTRNVTIGAKRTSMIRSLTATWTSVYAG